MTHAFAFGVGLLLAALVGGCASESRVTQPRYSAPAPMNVIESSITSGTREKASGLSVWDVEITVDVTARGPAFNYRKWSVLRLRGSFSATDYDRWLCFNDDGWPESYEVEAEYQASTEDSGRVEVSVRVTDYLHPSGGQTIYSATHEIHWTDDIGTP